MKLEDCPITPTYKKVESTELTKKEFIQLTLLQGMVIKYGITDSEWNKEMLKRSKILTNDFLNQEPC